MNEIGDFTSMNRTNIEEANKHLQALYQRVQQLERGIKEQNDLLAAKDNFIQTKIKELSAQDLIIQELKQELRSQTVELQNKKYEVESLKTDLGAKVMENNALREKSKLMNTLLDCIPDLHKVVSQMDTVVSRAKDLETHGYIEVSGSSSTAEDGDTADTLPSETRTENDLIPSDSGIGMTDVSSHQISTDLVLNGESSVGEMARNFVKSGRMHKFSVSEDDANPEEEPNIQNTIRKTDKEMYF